jgi:hypothetical protein
LRFAKDRYGDREVAIAAKLGYYVVDRNIYVWDANVGFFTTDVQYLQFNADYVSLFMLFWTSLIEIPRR